MAATVVLVSGGINSTVAAARSARIGGVHLLHADFGQAAARRQAAAVRDIAEAMGVPATIIQLPHVAQIAGLRKRVGETAQGDARSGITVPDSVSKVLGLMPLLLGAAFQLAQRVGATVVLSGASELADEMETESAPGRGTPDHGRETAYLANLLFEQLQRTRTPIRLETPFMDMTRGDVVKLGLRFQVPFDLTYSCRTGQQAPCSTCPACVTRRQAFQAAGLADPAGTEHALR